jgi:putative ABC transport system permease protein
MKRLLHRVLHGLVRLLPAEFRHDFGPAIREDLAARTNAGDRVGLVRRELPSLAGAVVREHLHVLRRDAGYALRLMRRTPAFTAMAILMLALGTGVNVAMFSIIDAVMLRSPFREPDRLVEVAALQKPTTSPDWRSSGASVLTHERLANLAALSDTFVSVAAYDGATHILTGQGDPRSVRTECVSGSMFDLLGTPPLLGRTLGSADDRAGASAAIVLRYEFWRELGGSPSIVGATITLNQTPVTIVGVMPRGFGGPYAHEPSRTQAWMPLGRPTAGGGESGCASSRFQAFGRLRNGLTLDSANARLGPQAFVAVSLHDQTFEDVEAPLWSLSAAVACVLLIACFNVGGLQMERMLARRREMAVRLALGASRARILRQTLTESVVLSLAGAAAGLAAAGLTLGAIVSLLPSDLPHLGEIALDPRVLAATLVVATMAGLVAGLIPAGQTWRIDPAADLADGTRSSERRGSWARRGLVVAEIALSVAVLIGAGLMIQTFLILRPTRPGFEPDRKMIGLVQLPRATPEEGDAFAARLMDRLQTTPGVRAAALSTNYPMRGATTSLTVQIDGKPERVNSYRVTPGYLEMMKMPLVAGRTFTAGDGPGREAVVVVNEDFAERLRPGGRVLGESLPIGRRAAPSARAGTSAATAALAPASRPPTAEAPVERRIVGIVANARFASWHTRTQPEIFVPLAQQPSSGFYLIAESDGRPDDAFAREVHATLRVLRPDLVVDDLASMSALLDEGVKHWRFGAWLLGVLAGLAVLLASIGLMATIGWWVRQRTRELGVRLALGASRWQIARLVGRQGLMLAALGSAVGCAGAAGVTRYLESWLYGVTPLDAPTFALGAAMMLIVAAIVIVVPVRHATAVDPVSALKVE